MPFDLKEVHKAARLARVAIQEEDLAIFGDEIYNILTWIEQLNQVDTSTIKPMASAVQTSTPLREDVVEVTNSQEDILKNAPKTVQGFYAVPKVVE